MFNDEWGDIENMLDYPSYNGCDDELMPEWAKNGCIRCGNRIAWNNKNGYCPKCRARLTEETAENKQTE